LEGSGRDISTYYTGICQEGLRKTTKNVSVPAEIRTEHLSVTCLKCYPYDHPLGNNCSSSSSSIRASGLLRFHSIFLTVSVKLESKVWPAIRLLAEEQQV
jgi:hypothetical protein